MLVFLLLLLFFHFSTPQSIQGHNPPLFRVGRCRSNTSVDPIINTQTLANENQGFWVFSAVPAVAETDRLAWAHMRADATLTGNIVLSFYTQIQNEELKVGLKAAVEDSILYSTARTLTDLGPWVDYRYVVSVTDGWPLPNSEKNHIRRIDYNNKMSLPQNDMTLHDLTSPYYKSHHYLVVSCLNKHFVGYSYGRHFALYSTRKGLKLLQCTIT